MYNFEDLVIGTKYVSWGDDIRQGIDCMGLVTHVLTMRGIDAGHLKDRTHKTFDIEACRNWRKIDITTENITGRTVVVGFLNADGKVRHVGIMKNNHEFYHCPDVKGITVSSLTRPAWQRQEKVFYMHNLK